MICYAEVHIHILYARAPLLSSYPLKSSITPGILQHDSKLQRANEYQMSRWKSSWEYIVKRKHGLPPTPFIQAQSHISKRCTRLSSSRLKNLNRCGFDSALNLILGLKIKPWSLHIAMKQSDLIFPQWAAWTVPQRASASELHMCNVASPPLTHPHTRTCVWTADLFIHHRPSNMHRCT